MVERISNPRKHRNPESNWKGRISEMKMEVCGRCGSKPDWRSGWHLERDPAFAGVKLKQQTNQLTKAKTDKKSKPKPTKQNFFFLYSSS